VATGDYRPGTSDIDAVALVERAPTPARRAVLVECHRRLARDADGGDALHCVYVSATDAEDVTRRHWTWAFDELFRRPLSGIARGELLADPVVVVGPDPSTWLSAMGHRELADAARAELAGYWTRAVRKRAIWDQDVYVDLGLTVWARADATIGEGRLITKSEAMARMGDRGVPQDVVDGIARRRRGETTVLDDDQRRDRAVWVRQFLTGEIERLVSSSRDL
jgi:hypothetical protein